ncbi:squalene synthase 2-like isoform X2 [Apium graveolens]|uniref:squalene synthase 2-like isoform X2 n=1 Tax=Apium graveolens TaxID=4045 RepID=UPI003D7A2EDA
MGSLGAILKHPDDLYQQLGPQLRDAVCIFYLVLRALDTVEDDTSISAEVKVPILINFHRQVYDNDWHFSYRYHLHHTGYPLSYLSSNLSTNACKLILMGIDIFTADCIAMGMSMSSSGSHLCNNPVFE